jgi:hypothetical protein
MNDAPISRKEMRKFHAMLRDISKQIPLFGEMAPMPEWKIFVFACLFGQDCVENPWARELPSAPRFVVRNNKRTNDLTVSGGAQLITLLYSFGNTRGVEWSDPKWKAEMAAYAQEAHG